MEGKEIIGREFRFGYHLQAIPDKRKDTHVIKEILHYSDGTTEPQLRILEEFKRPFWITKEHYKKHKEKKESESLEHVNKYFATESDLPKEVLSRLGGMYNGKKTRRDAIASPYVYGLDVDALTMMKQYYTTRYPDCTTPYSIATLDTEVDIDTNTLIIISVACEEEIYVAILADFVQNRSDIDRQLNYLFKNNIPECDLKEKIVAHFETFDNEMDMVRAAFKKLHSWKKDFAAIWNISYDIKVILGICEKFNVDPEDIFSDPSLPENLREFKWIEGQIQKVTESGKMKPLEPREQWHCVHAPSSMYWIDMMSAYNFIRVGGKNVPGGYKLDNILNYELGSNYKKLKFKDENTSILEGTIDWHKYMVSKKPLEYVIYNCWDSMSMLALDKKTQDLSISLPLLSGPSSFNIFNSGPKKLVNEMHFFYLEHGLVLGTKGPSVDDDKLLSLDNWIVLLPNFNVSNKEYDYLSDAKDITNNIRMFVADSDQSSGYPSDTLAANVSKDTTMRELLSVEGLEKEEFKLNNINLMFGKVNHIDYVSRMMKFPTLRELCKGR